MHENSLPLQYLLCVFPPVGKAAKCIACGQNIKGLCGEKDRERKVSMIMSVHLLFSHVGLCCPYK